MHPTLSDQIEQWIDAARHGSTDALGSIAESCRPYLLHIANTELNQTIRSKVGGSDVVQQSLLEACRDFKKFGGHRQEDLMAWLRQILLNNIANVNRTFQATHKRNISREVPFPKTETSALTLWDDVHHKCVNKEEQTMVAGAIEKMSATLREVLLLHHEQQLTFPEIAVRMNRSPDAVRKLWARAVKSLQQLVSSS